MKTGSFVAGDWYSPDTGKTIRNINPANTDDIIAEFGAAGSDDTERAVAAAMEAFDSWSKVPGPERGRLLWRTVEVARRRADEIAAMMTREIGKVQAEARGETAKGINVLEYYAGEGFRIEGRTSPSEVRDTFVCTIRRPIGVVGAITPWNFPWAIACWKIAPALVAGNTVVFKPASITPGTASLLVECFEEAGVPPGVLNMIVGSGATAGQRLVEHKAVRALSFTGSNGIGMALCDTAAARGAKVTCEMGGKNAVVVLADADIDKAASAIASGGFGGTGQRCTATSRVIAHPDVVDALLEALVGKAQALKIGDPADPTVTMGPAADAEQLKTDLDYIAIARAEGARLVHGGGRPAGLDMGYFVEPTIFCDVDPGMRVFQEEIFGPVVAVSTAQDFDEAIRMANAVEYGLSAAIFTSDINKAMRFIEGVEVGMVHVNEPTIGGEAQLPFGGTKATGVGDREMAKEGLNFYTEIKTVFINYSASSERTMIR